MNSSKELVSQLSACSYRYDSMPQWRPAYVTTAMSASLVSISAINLVVSPCTIFLNIMVMIVVKTRPPLRNNYNVLLACLAGTDLMTGALGQPLFAAEQIYRITGSFESDSVCVLKSASGVFAVTSVIASVQHLALLSIERYIAIKYPYKYVEIVTKRRLTSTVIFAWSTSAFLTVLTAMYSVNNLFNSFFRNFIMVGSISILIFCQIAVYLEARKQVRKIKAQQISVEAKEMFLKDKKALHTTTIVIGIVLLSYVPLITFRLVLKPLLSSPAMKFVLESGVRSLLLCNSVCNPLIYCARNREFRRAFERLLLRQSQVQSLGTSSSRSEGTE